MLSPTEPIMKYAPLWGIYTPEGLLGRGSYGSVYSIVRQDAAGVFRSACKLISIPKNNDELASAVRENNLSKSDAYSYFDGIFKRILSEINIMYALRGEPNIVSYEDHWVVHKPPAISWDILIRMELLTTLSDYRKRSGMKPDDVRRLGISLCSALTACEKNNIIHRDIKEANIFVDSAGRFKLGDFGVARVAASASSGMSLVGTPAYIAPEVYAKRLYDSTADIYSLGIMMYKLLNEDRYPFMPLPPSPVTPDTFDAAFARRMRGDRVPPPLHGDDDLKNAVCMALSFDPSRRFRIAAAFKDALSSGARSW